MENDTPRRMPNVPPFVKFVCANVPMVFDDSLSYYEALCALWKYVQGMTDVINNNATLEEEFIEKFNELSGKFDELKTYVDTYFDNLDVQEEINNKLDQMAEDGVFQEIINAYLDQMLSEVRYIFPKNFTDESNTQFGDLCAIKAYNKNIMIDTGHANYKEQVEEFLTRNNINHIDHLILSHYHADHIGNVINLINDGYLDSTSVIYLAPYCDLLTSVEAFMSTYYAITSAANNADITTVQPTEGYTLDIDDNFKIKFYNFDRSFLDDPSKLTLRDYNNASAINLVEHGEKRVLFTGDCYDEPVNRLIDNGSIKNSVDLYKVNHHGIDSSTVNTNKFAFLAPQYAFLPANTGYVINNDLARSKYLHLLGKLGTRTYAQYLSDVDTIFISTTKALHSLSGVAIKITSSIPNDQTIYVDCNTEVLDPDGTSTKPYKDLGQAFAAVLGGSGIYRFNLADGNYNTSHGGNSWADIPTISNATIRIFGHSGNRGAVRIKDGFQAFNCNVYLNNLTVDVTTFRNEAITLNDCNLSADYCDFIGDDSSSNKKAAIYAERTNITLRSCNFTWLNRAINTQITDIKMIEGTFTDCEYVVYNNGLGKVYTNKLNFVRCTNRFQGQGYATEFNCMKALSNDVTSEVETTLNDDITQYNQLIVESGSFGNDTFVTDTIYSFRTNKFALGTTYYARSKSGLISIEVDASDGTKITVTTPDANESVRAIYGSYVSLPE